MANEYNAGIEANEKLVQFDAELTELINRLSLDSYSKTPDYILAGYLVACLVAFNVAAVMRDNSKK